MAGHFHDFFAGYKVFLAFFWGFFASSVVCSYIIVSMIYSFKLKSNFQKVMQVEENVFGRRINDHMVITF